MSSSGRVVVVKPPLGFHRVLEEEEKRGGKRPAAVFLAGSIEMGKAEDWQGRVARELEEGGAECVVLNPRRQEWDASWEQSADNPLFVEQVTWELDALDAASLIMLHLCPSTMAPISLLELGLHARSGRLAVSCPPGFWRRGNVQVVCARHNVPLFDSLAQLISHALLSLRPAS